MIFVDTNYFLRFLLKDQKIQHSTAKNLFIQAAKNEIELCTSLIVFFEIYWVLSSFYRKEKSELIEKLEGLLSFAFIHLQDREIFEQAVRIFKETSLDLEDAYNLVYASANKASEFKTFDKKLQKIFGRNNNV